MNNTLVRLETSQPCGCEISYRDEIALCSKPAYWLLNGVPVCDHDIRDIAEMNSDNEAWLSQPLADMAARNLAQFFAHIVENLTLIETELELDMSAVHTIEIVPGMFNSVYVDWIVHINEERSADIRRNAFGQCELTFQAWYSDFDYLFGEQEEATR